MTRKLWLILSSIPNLPFFYLVFRAWSHWRALAGSKHLEFLLNEKLLTPQPSRILEQIYSRGRPQFGEKTGPKVVQSSSEPSVLNAQHIASEEEEMVLRKEDAKEISEALKVPELEMELGRAVWQVERILKKKEELVEEKKELDKAGPNSKDR